MTAPGEVIAGRFDVLRLAGSGGMGALYECHDRTTGERVAVKLLHVDGERERARFAREAQVLAALRHPAIVRYLCHGESDGRMFLAMAWLEGEVLSHTLARGALDLGAALKMFARVADALAFAHRAGVVHRDLKPDNLFLPAGDPERVTVLDFGIARRHDATAGLTRTGALVGTPGYMAPEQCRGARDLDARADVFSLGCMLYECAVGEPPYRGEHVLAVLARILLEPTPHLRVARPDLPDALDDLVARMMAQDPRDRPADMDAVAAALRSLAVPDDAARANGRAQATSPTVAESITDRERRWCWLVFVHRPDGDALDDAPRAESVADVIALPDGSRLATVTGAGQPGDHAARAARLALSFHARWPSSAVAVCMAQRELGTTNSMASAIDRATALIQRGSGVVRVDEATARLLAGRHALTADGNAFTLHDAADHVAARDGLFVGRDRELAGLVALRSECVDESAPRVALITAPAGGGKSRVLRALRARDAEGRTHHGRGDAISAGSTLAVVASLLRDMAGVPEGADVDARRDAVRALVAAHVAAGDAARVTVFLCELAGAPMPDGADAMLDAARRAPLLMADQVRRAWEDLVDALSADAPLTLLVEDLHWGDVASVRLLDAALRRCESRPLCLVATARPEVHEVFPGLWKSHATQEFRLGPLPRRASENLARALLGARATDARVARVVEQSAGHPYFLEELARAVDRDDAALPESVLAAVQSRLAALDPTARRVLRAASVYGRAFWVSGVLELLGGELDADGLAPWLDHLVEQELVAPKDASRFAGEREYTFRQALVREGAWSMLVEADVTRGHRAAAAWLARVGEADPVVMAQHLERGGDGNAAAKQRLRAAAMALDANDLDAAIAHATRAEALDADGVLLEDAWVILAEAHSWRGDAEQAARYVEEVMAVADAGGAAWCRAAVAGVVVAIDHGLVERIFAMLVAFGGVEPDDASRAIFLQGLAAIAMACFVAGQVDMARAHLARMESLADGVDDVRTRAMVGKARAWQAFWSDGDPRAARALAETSMRDFERAMDPRTAAFTAMDVANFAWAAGDLTDAARFAREALATADRAGLELTASLARTWLAFSLAEGGSAAEAEVEARRAVDGATRRGSAVSAGLARWSLAEALRAQRKLDEAEAVARAALDDLMMSPANHVGVQVTLAEVLLDGGRADEAREVTRDATARAAAMEGPVPHRGDGLRAMHARAEAAAGA